jgi:hypothetical protein
MQKTGIILVIFKIFPIFKDGKYQRIGGQSSYSKTVLKVLKKFKIDMKNHNNRKKTKCFP